MPPASLLSKPRLPPAPAPRAVPQRGWRGATGRWLSSLKARIMLLAVLTGLLSATGTALVVLQSTERSIRTLVLDSAREDRARHANLLGSKVAVLRDLLGAAATHLPPAAWDDPQEMGRLLQEASALGAVFRVVYAAGTDGRVIARIDGGRLGGERPDISGRAYFRRALATRQPVVSDVLWGRVVDAPVVVIAVPVLDASGRPQGVLAGVLTLASTALFDHGGAAPERPAVRELVIDRAGRLLTHPDPQRLMGQADDEPGLRDAVRGVLALAASQPAGGPASAAVRGDQVVSMAPIPFTDWISLHLSPLDEAMAPVAAARRAALPAALLGALVAGGLAGGLGYALTGPITRLRQRTESLLDDDGHRHPWPEDRGEVGALAHTLRQVVEQRDRRQHEAQALLQQLRAVLDHADVGIALTRGSRFALVSRQFCTLFGIDAQDAIGQSTRLIYPSDAARDALVAQARHDLAGCGLLDTELQLLRADGTLFWARLRGRAVVPGDMAQGTIWTIEDISAARAEREQLAWRASHDSLTGLLNREAFERALEAAAARAADAPFCALFIDLDRFKQVNDSAGHAAGDALLRGVAGLLQARLRPTDLVARLGGDEFAVLLPACPADQARALADGLRQAVQAHALDWEGQRLQVGASIGLVRADGRDTSAADVLRAADMACYQAKKRGRSRVEQFEPSGFSPLPA